MCSFWVIYMDVKEGVRRLAKWDHDMRCLTNPRLAMLVICTTLYTATINTAEPENGGGGG